MANIQEGPFMRILEIQQGRHIHVISNVRFQFINQKVSPMECKSVDPSCSSTFGKSDTQLDFVQFGIVTTQRDDDQSSGVEFYEYDRDTCSDTSDLDLDFDQLDKETKTWDFNDREWSEFEYTKHFTVDEQGSGPCDSNNPRTLDILVSFYKFTGDFCCDPDTGSAFGEQELTLFETFEDLPEIEIDGSRFHLAEIISYEINDGEVRITESIWAEPAT